MKFSENFYKYIIVFEGFKSKAYKCPAGIWTIGYGTTKGVKPGMSITQEQAYKLLQDDCSILEKNIERLKIPNLKQCQFDAIGLICYNIGFMAFASSTLCVVIRKNPNNSLIKDLWGQWCHVKGVKIKGLQIRRAKEYELYTNSNP